MCVFTLFWKHKGRGRGRGWRGRGRGRGRGFGGQEQGDVMFSGMGGKTDYHRFDDSKSSSLEYNAENREKWCENCPKIVAADEMILWPIPDMSDTDDKYQLCYHYIKGYCRDGIHCGWRHFNINTMTEEICHWRPPIDTYLNKKGIVIPNYEFPFNPNNKKELLIKPSAYTQCETGICDTYPLYMERLQNQLQELRRKTGSGDTTTTNDATIATKKQVCALFFLTLCPCL